MSPCQDTTSPFSYKYHCGHFYPRHHYGKHSPLSLSSDLQQREKGIRSGQKLNTTPRHLLVTSLSANDHIFFSERVQHIETHGTHHEFTPLLQPVALEPPFAVLLRKSETSIHRGDGENVQSCSRRRGHVGQPPPSSRILGKRHQLCQHLRPMEPDAPQARP